VTSDIHVGDLVQQVIMFQLFNTGNLSKGADGDSLIISPTSWPTQTLPDAMDPSKALSETDITDKVHDLSNIPLPKVKIDISIEERRIAVLRFLMESYGRLHTEKILNPKVNRLFFFCASVL